MPKLTIKGLQAALEAANGVNKTIAQRVEGLMGELREGMRRQEKANVERDVAHKEVACLKEAMLILEAENARLNGYIERVREDDMARDPPVKVGEHVREEFQPRRAPAKRSYVHQDRAVNFMAGDGEDCLHDHQRKHWTSFGN